MYRALPWYFVHNLNTLRYHLATHLHEKMYVCLSGFVSWVFLQLRKEAQRRIFRLAHYKTTHFVSKPFFVSGRTVQRSPCFLNALDLWLDFAMEIVIMNPCPLHEENMNMCRTRWRSHFFSREAALVPTL